MMAFGAISTALLHKERTGEGQFIDISLVEPIFNIHPFQVQGPSITEGKTRLRRTGRHFGSVPPAGTYKGPEGWLVLQVLEPQWPRLCEAAASIGLGGDPRFTTRDDRADNRYELVEVLEEWIQTFPSDAALFEHLEAHPSFGEVCLWATKGAVFTYIDFGNAVQQHGSGAHVAR